MTGPETPSLDLEENRRGRTPSSTSSGPSATSRSVGGRSIGEPATARREVFVPQLFCIIDGCCYKQYYDRLNNIESMAVIIRGAAEIMQDQLALGIVLFGLLVVPFLSYGILSCMARRDVRGNHSREETAPSTTQAHPSRTIPGGGSRREE